MHCPSCKSKNVDVVETFDTEIIKNHYLETGLDVSNLFENIHSLDYVKCSECGLKFFNPIILGDDKYYAHLQKEDWYFLHEDKTEYEFSKKYINDFPSIIYHYIIKKREPIYSIRVFFYRLLTINYKLTLTTLQLVLLSYPLLP